jgi:hypothetical protein
VEVFANEKESEGQKEDVSRQQNKKQRRAAQQVQCKGRAALY